MPHLYALTADVAVRVSYWLVLEQAALWAPALFLAFITLTLDGVRYEQGYAIFDADPIPAEISCPWLTLLVVAVNCARTPTWRGGQSWLLCRTSALCSASSRH